MKKILLIVILIISLTSCSGRGSVAIENEKINIVTTTFASYDFVREIIKGNEDSFEVVYLLDSGMDLHSYQPTAEDILKVDSADLFIYVGGESEKWVSEILKDVTNEKLQKLNLLEAIKEEILLEEINEGMEGESEGEETEYDEHIWLSVKNAKLLCMKIMNAICVIDNDNSKLYGSNLNVYLEKLDKLDTKFYTMIDDSTKDTLLFGDRFPFRYFVEDYDLKYYAPFVGCSAETEASFETVVFLANKLDEYDLDYCLTVDNGNKKLATTIIESSKNPNRKILTLNSMQKLTSKDIEMGASYLSIMEENFLVFQEALK